MVEAHPGPHRCPLNWQFGKPLKTRRCRTPHDACMNAKAIPPASANASPALPRPLPEHPRAPVALGCNGAWNIIRLDGTVLALRPRQLTRRRVAGLFAGCPELLTRTWPDKRRRDGWDAVAAAESLIVACGKRMLWPRQLENLGLRVRYRWRDGHGRLHLISLAELDRLTAEALERAA